MNKAEFYKSLRRRESGVFGTSPAVLINAGLGGIGLRGALA